MPKMKFLGKGFQKLQHEQYRHRQNVCRSRKHKIKEIKLQRKRVHKWPPYRRLDTINIQTQWVYTKIWR